MNELREGAYRFSARARDQSELIIEEIETELDRDMPPDLQIQVELVWEPPWTTERMSPSAKRFMGW